MMMRNIRQTFLRPPSRAVQKESEANTTPHHRTHPTRSPVRVPRRATTLLLNLGQNLRILKKEVFLQNKTINLPAKKTKKTERTSSPTLIALPPQPGNNTRSPALTDVGTTWPSLFGAPGPTAITVASGSGLDVAEVGRNIPDDVF